ncbi:hypothetical protein CK203_098141 [Vitis vinifera]|uniref:Uncharacterized protein n=1 Tax=Vitis vinifera TaxID=29760 RepID=A0A438C674_VITVI|nr:hypothetical protein CK203_098141 [Vitis vinifera]
MAIVSSHSWSLFLETRRKSSSLSHIKLNKTSEEAISTLHCLAIRGQEPPLRRIQHLGPRPDHSIFEGGVPSNPPQRRYEMRRPLTTPGDFFAPETQKVALQLIGPGLQALDSRQTLQLDPRPLPILSVLPACHATAVGASGFIWTAQRYHLEHLMTPREFFHLSGTRLLSVYDTHGAQSPIAIHFSIDGRQGILEARHVAQALDIPYELVDPQFLE